LLIQPAVTVYPGDVVENNRKQYPHQGYLQESEERLLSGHKSVRRVCQGVWMTRQELESV